MTDQPDYLTFEVSHKEAAEALAAAEENFSAAVEARITAQANFEAATKALETATEGRHPSLHARPDGAAQGHRGPPS